MLQCARVPTARRMRILLAAGIPVRDETEVPADLVSFVGDVRARCGPHGEEAILAFTRVLGAAASNVAEAAVALLMMNAFERAQRRAEPAWSWLGSGPPADGGTEGPTEVVALGFVDLVASTAWGQSMALRDQILALTRFESAAWTSAVLGRGRVITTIGFDVFSAAPTAASASRSAGWSAGMRPPSRPGGGGDRSRHFSGRRLLRPTHEPGGPGQGRCSGRSVPG
jgi:hypothetical protein